MLEKVEEIIKGGREDNWAIPVKDVKDGARESEMWGLDDLGIPELEDGVNSEDDLEEGEGLSCWVIFKDVFTPYSEEGGELGSEREKVGAVKCGVSKRSRDVGVLNGSEIPKFPEVESRVGRRRIGEGKVTGGGMRGKIGRSAHCGARSKREEGTRLRTYLGLRRLHSAIDAEG